MKERGFTLIELLGIIILLAVIALIATPIIINIIEKSKPSAVLRGGELYLKAVETQLARENIKEPFNPTKCVINKDGNVTCDDKSLIIETIGNKPISGVIELEKGKIITVTEMVLEGYELLKEPDERLKIKGAVKDETPAEVKVNINVVTTNSITITVEAIDEETGIKEYLYSIDGKEYKKGNNIYILDNLASGEKYTIYVKVVNGSNLETVKMIEVTTLSINEPTYEIDNSGWSTSKTVTITYPIIEGQELTYEYSIDKGLTWKPATQIQQVTFTENGTIIARVTDGTNKINGTTLTINKIDTTSPIVTEVTGNNDTWSINKTLIVTATDNESGIKEYSFDNGATWQTSNQKIVTSNGTYSIKVRDEAGNISEATSIEINKISTTAPTISISSSTVGSNFIIVQATIVDNEMGIEKIEYSNDGGSTWENGETNTTYTFNGLTKNTNYQIKARVTSNNGKVTISNVITINTKDITIPTYSITPTGEATSKTVTITYPKLNDQTLTYEYSLDKGSTWKAATQVQQVTFTENGTIIARVKDGTNTVTANTYTIDNIIEYLVVNPQVQSADTTFLGGTILRSKIEAITIVDNKTVPSNAIGSWDVSERKNGNVMAWYTDANNNGMYELYIGSNGGVYANPNSSFLFQGFTNVKTMNLNNLKTNKVTNMQFMFYDCINITNLDVSRFNTSQVTNMYAMFHTCENLGTLNLSNFDTGKVTNMGYMFNECHKLTTLNISNFNTSNVINMYSMFWNCQSLISLDLSRWNTSQVTNMGGMFAGCNILTSLIFGNNFVTSKVTDMDMMFQNCSSLTSLNVSNFNTSQVTTMRYMFNKCEKLTSLNLKSFDTGKVTNMYAMFNGCKALKELDLSNFNTSQVTNMYAMFNNCNNMVSLNLSNFNTTNVTNMQQMFCYCNSLVTLDIRKASFNNVTSYTYFFYDIKNLQTIYTKDTTTKTWINSRLSDAGKTGVTITIA